MFGRSLNKYTSNERKPVQIFPWVDKKISSLHLAHKSNSFILKHQFFLSLKAVLLKEAKRFYFFVTIEFFVSITFATKLVHKRKKNEASTHCCFWKTNLKMTVERRQNHLRQSELIFQKTFRTLPQKWRNFQGCLFFLLWVEAQNEIGRNSFRIDWC